MFVITCIWGLVILFLKATFSGNPAYKLVSNTSMDVIDEATKMVETGELNEDSDAYKFVSSFSKYMFNQTLILFIEIGICVYFLIRAEPEIVFTAAFILLCKNLLMFGISFHLTEKSESNVFLMVLNLPKWMLKLDRLSAVVSVLALGVILFVEVNKFILQ